MVNCESVYCSTTTVVVVCLKTIILNDVSFVAITWILPWDSIRGLIVWQWGSLIKATFGLSYLLVGAKS